MKNTVWRLCSLILLMLASFVSLLSATSSPARAEMQPPKDAPLNLLTYAQCVSRGAVPVFNPDTNKWINTTVSIQNFNHFSSTLAVRYGSNEWLRLNRDVEPFWFSTTTDKVKVQSLPRSEGGLNYLAWTVQDGGSEQHYPLACTIKPLRCISKGTRILDQTGTDMHPVVRFVPGGKENPTVTIYSGQSLSFKPTEVTDGTRNATRPGYDPSVYQNSTSSTEPSFLYVYQNHVGNFKMFLYTNFKQPRYYPLECSGGVISYDTSSSSDETNRLTALSQDEQVADLLTPQPQDEQVANFFADPDGFNDALLTEELDFTSEQEG